jgi:hypothetical protein
VNYLNSSNECYVTGTFTGNAAFDNFTLMSNGLEDVFTGKINSPFISVYEYEQENNWLLYPSPAAAGSRVFINGVTEPKNLEIALTDMTGKLNRILINQSSDEFVYIDLPAQLADGIYILSIISGNRNYMKKLMVLQK